MGLQATQRRGAVASAVHLEDGHVGIPVGDRALARVGLQLHHGASWDAVAEGLITNTMKKYSKWTKARQPTIFRSDFRERAFTAPAPARDRGPARDLRGRHSRPHPPAPEAQRLDRRR